MLEVKKTKDVGYETADLARAAQDRLGGAGSVKQGTTGKWYHQVPFTCLEVQIEHLHEDIDAIIAKFGENKKGQSIGLAAINNGIDLHMRTLVEDGKDPVKTATAKRDAVFEEITDWTIETGNKTYREQIKAAKAVSVKAYNQWMDDFIASNEYADGSWKTL